MISQAAQPKQWRKTVTTTARPISEIIRSGAGTTFTVTRVSDSGAWDLSNVQAGDVIEVVDSVSGEIYYGRVKTVDDAGDFIDLEGSAGWIKAAVSGRGIATMKPTDGSVAIIHRLDKCTYAVIDGVSTNSLHVFLGFDDTVTVGGGANPGHDISNNPAHSNFRLELEIGLDRYLDLTRVYVIAASTQYLSIIAM